MRLKAYLREEIREWKIGDWDQTVLSRSDDGSGANVSLLGYFSLRVWLEPLIDAERDAVSSL